MKKQIILVAFPNGGSLALEAYTFGPLAVHRMHNRSGVVLDGWIVTHVRTGCAIVKALSFRDACSLAKDARGFNWTWGVFGVQSVYNGRSGVELETLNVLKRLLRGRGL